MIKHDVDRTNWTRPIAKEWMGTARINRRMAEKLTSGEAKDVSPYEAYDCLWLR